MSRRRGAESREIQPDPVYSSTLAAKFINSMMWEGKKTIAQGIFYGALEAMQEKAQDDPLKLFKKAVENAKPLLEVKTRRVGGANYQVPSKSAEPADLARHPLDTEWSQVSRRARDGRKTGRRASGRRQYARRRDQEEGRRPPHGGGQQGFCPLPLVVQT